MKKIIALIGVAAICLMIQAANARYQGIITSCGTTYYYSADLTVNQICRLLDAHDVEDCGVKL